MLFSHPIDTYSCIFLNLNIRIISLLEEFIKQNQDCNLRFQNDTIRCKRWLKDQFLAMNVANILYAFRLVIYWWKGTFQTSFPEAADMSEACDMSASKHLKSQSFFLCHFSNAIIFNIVCVLCALFAWIDFKYLNLH